MLWATQVCMMQIPGRKWGAISWLFQYPAVHCIIHFACYTASPFGGISSSQMYCLGADCVIHCMLQVARSLLKASKSQKQWKVYKLGPIPVLHPRGPGGERIVDVVPEGTELDIQVKKGELGRLHTLAIIPTSCVLEFIVHKQWIMLIQMNCIEFNSRDPGSLH